MSQVLRRAACSRFSKEIECMEMTRRFTRPPFTIYDGKTDPVEHISHYIHMMSLYSHNDGLMCKAFPSSLGLTTMCWFNGLRKGSIRSFEELIQEFDARFITCSRVQQPIRALLSMKMRGEETLQSYMNKYWELYNEIGYSNEQVTTSTFQLGLFEDSELRDSLTMRPPKGMHQLIRRLKSLRDWRIIACRAGARPWPPRSTVGSIALTSSSRGPQENQ
ncbi:uncharacterized protein LOC142632440 [Castanea sativa]|uniref:uncharacterized protein LOC142632440 n=1 Tax=Castanea sativa TaxID=21020 RepID=UPI003F651AF9